MRRNKIFAITAVGLLATVGVYYIYEHARAVELERSAARENEAKQKELVNALVEKRRIETQVSISQDIVNTLIRGYTGLGVVKDATLIREKSVREFGSMIAGETETTKNVTGRLAIIGMSKDEVRKIRGEPHQVRTSYLEKAEKRLPDGINLIEAWDWEHFLTKTGYWRETIYFDSEGKVCWTTSVQQAVYFDSENNMHWSESGFSTAPREAIEAKFIQIKQQLRPLMQEMAIRGRKAIVGMSHYQVRQAKGNPNEIWTAGDISDAKRAAGVVEEWHWQNGPNMPFEIVRFDTDGLVLASTDDNITATPGQLTRGNVELIESVSYLLKKP